MSALQDHLDRGSIKLNDTVESCMYAFNKKGSSGVTANKYEVITPDTSLAELGKFFN
jgi:cystathionine beta-synthase